MAYPWGTPSSQTSTTIWHGPAATSYAPPPPPPPPKLSYEIGPGGEKKFYGLSLDQLTNIADPWASQRGQYQTALSKMISDPSSFTSSPLFQSATQAGIDAVNRNMASRGLLRSGNRLTALMDYGQQKAPETFFKMADLLTTLGGGRNQNPGGGLTAAAQLSGAQTGERNAAINEFNARQQADISRYNAETGRIGAQTGQAAQQQQAQNQLAQQQQFTNTWRAQQEQAQREEMRLSDLVRQQQEQRQLDDLRRLSEQYDRDRAYTYNY